MRRLVLLALGATVACTAPEPGNAGMAVQDDIPVRGEAPGYRCRKPGDRNFIGQVATAQLGARMMAAARARTLRWVPHGAMITMEYNPSRLTVRLDARNRVVSMSCG